MKNHLLCCALITFSFFAVSQTKPRRIEVLFLGDNGHHKPIERFSQIAPALGAKGINFTYTADLKDINGPNLAKFDAILVYANHDNIDKFAEKALLDFVASGKGILPIHCASYCFRNSAEYVKMVGGQFWRHTVDTVQAYTVSPYHEIMRGLKPIRSFDETYLHSQLQEDNNILQMRPIGPDQANDKPNVKAEPYTWTRKYGLGNVFYTAYGHDENTWSNENFQQLIYNGILFTIKDEVKNAHKALDPKPFEYREAHLPNYEKREGPQLQQLPLSPEESMKYIQIPADFNLSLFAAEPNVQHPIAMAWDEKGRLYVLITKDYPNERKETGGTDFILICEDTNADGKADKFIKFADGLSIPTGLVFSNGGIVVSQAPHMLFLKDTDGDDKADERKILFSGFGTSDTHAGPSNLHYGFDNWIWGCVGYSGYEGKISKIPGDTLKFGQAFFRFKTGLDGTEGPKMEWMTSTSNNTWGMAFNEAGDVFGSTANNAHGWYMAIPHQNLLNPGFNNDNGSRSTDTHKDMKTITSKVRQVDVFGGYTAASGHNFYTARAFPKEYWNQIAFVAEPTGHVLHQNKMVKNGTNYDDVEAFNLMAGADEWFSPVFAEVGPDGAVWVADWYSFIIQHNPKPDGFKMGVGNAYETDLRDYTHGRIYRVGHNKAPEYTPISLSKVNPKELVAALNNNNMFWRNHAQRLLVERGNLDIVPDLLTIVNNMTTDELGLNTAAIHALWVLHGLGVIDKNAEVNTAVIAALKHPSWAVRKNAIQVLPNNEATSKNLISANLLADNEPIVVMNTILKLNKCPKNTIVEQAILARLRNATETNDRWLPDAFATAFTANNLSLLQKYLTKLNGKNETVIPHDHSKMMNENSSKTKSSQPKITNVKNKSTNVNSPTSAKSTVITAEPLKPKAKLAPQKGIDLEVFDLKFTPSKIMARENSRYSIGLINNGLDSLPSGIAIQIKIIIAGQGQEYTLVSHTHKTGVGPGQTVEITKNTNGPWSGDLSFSTDKIGEYSFTIVTDYEQKIKEYNENNNKFTQKVMVDQAKTVANLALERAMKSIASYYSADSTLKYFQKYTNIGADDKYALLKGIVAGTNGRRNQKLNAEGQNYITSIKNSLQNIDVDLAKRLFQNWNLNFGEELSNKNAIKITIKTIEEAMKFDLKTFTVKAGATVIIDIQNPDAMQHNLVIGKPNSLSIIGKAADKMITQTDAAEKNYVPNIPQIVAASPLINAKASYQLTFTAPNQVGNYPFVCTFPGHWQLMNGIMKVEK